MSQTTALLERKVRRFALVVAALTALGIPCLYAYTEYDGLSDALDFKAKIKASALSSLIASNPDVWMYAENRLQGLISHEPVPLSDELVQVLDSRQSVITEFGQAPPSPTLSRSYELHDSGQVVGQVIVTGSMRTEAWHTLFSAMLSLVAGVLVFRGLHYLLLAALKLATDAQERAETTLRSIGDAVITTDADGRIESANPVAEGLIGKSEAEVLGRQVGDFVQMHDSNDGGALEVSLYAALKSNAIVSCKGTSELRRLDGTSVAVEESAAPINDRSGLVVGGVLVLRDVTAAREYVERRSWEATHDALTGLLNRRGFESHVQAALSEAKAKGSPQVLCYMDLDGFKLVNDTAGHQAGDELLVQLARLLQAKVRNNDILGRLGGDEFGLLLRGCEGARAELIAADVLEAVNEVNFAYQGNSFKIGVSMGLTVITSDHAGVAEIFGEADCACYLAKEQGKNRVLRYVADDTRLAARRSEAGWVQRIGHAPEGRPVRSLPPGLQGARPCRGPARTPGGLAAHAGTMAKSFPQGASLPAAERFNLMPAIDRWVIEKVFSSHRALAAERGGAAPFAPSTCPARRSTRLGCSGSCTNGCSRTEWTSAVLPGVDGVRGCQQLARRGGVHPRLQGHGVQVCTRRFWYRGEFLQSFQEPAGRLPEDRRQLCQEHRTRSRRRSVVGTDQSNRALARQVRHCRICRERRDHREVEHLGGRFRAGLRRVPPPALVRRRVLP
ncbi:MAG: diguanylate cyclase [Ideonella sp.]|nr:diguanylate cyclase [Ideonella sp.]